MHHGTRLLLAVGTSLKQVDAQSKGIRNVGGLSSYLSQEKGSGQGSLDEAEVLSREKCWKPRGPKVLALCVVGLEVIVVTI